MVNYILFLDKEYSWERHVWYPTPNTGSMNSCLPGESQIDRQTLIQRYFIYSKYSSTRTLRDCLELGSKTSFRKKSWVFFFKDCDLCFALLNVYLHLCLTHCFSCSVTSGCSPVPVPLVFPSVHFNLSSKSSSAFFRSCDVSVSSPPWKCSFPVLSSFPGLSDKF